MIFLPHRKYDNDPKAQNTKVKNRLLNIFKPHKVTSGNA